MEATKTVRLCKHCSVNSLESENQLLKKVASLESRRKAFWIEDISNDDSLTKLYTGFVSLVCLNVSMSF